MTICLTPKRLREITTKSKSPDATFVTTSATYVDVTGWELTLSDNDGGYIGSVSMDNNQTALGLTGKLNFIKVLQDTAVLIDSGGFKIQHLTSGYVTTKVFTGENDGTLLKCQVHTQTGGEMTCFDSSTLSVLEVA